MLVRTDRLQIERGLLKQQFHHQKWRGGLATASTITSVFNIYLLYVHINTDSSGVITARSERKLSFCMSGQTGSSTRTVQLSVRSAFSVFELFSPAVARSGQTAALWHRGGGSGEWDWSRKAAGEPPPGSARLNARRC